ncbi:GxxExxY protein [Methylomagnum ishizawai]|uniref:GxxExxY protein n=1 Tax=Methylomagnum ishizawai TaxID=1760988 RepID=A0A1Y6D2D5_9GAMM|nr:GxxExxY protein [Methylomagnum ishizawai]SMF96550.1 GxxExxY protein [Methylomagnum ishizawai]
MNNEPTPEENRTASIIVDACVQLHMSLGPGLLESVYERILAHELTRRGCRVARQVSVPITYGGVSFEEGFRADLIVDDRLIVELKSVEKLAPVHKKQLLTYLRLTGMRLGLLVNFGEELMKTGIHRIINNGP